MMAFLLLVGNFLFVFKSKMVQNSLDLVLNVFIIYIYL